MYFGFASLASYRFLAAGFWVVMVTALGLGLVYAVGNSRGQAAARTWIGACMIVLAAGGIADIAWAVISGQWALFMARFGFGPLAEMIMLAAMLIGTMWWMAVRYADGLKK